MPELTEEKLYNILNELNKDQLKKIQEVSEKQTKLVREEIKNTFTDVSEKLNVTNKNIQELKKTNIELQRRIRKNNIIIFGLEYNKENLLIECLEKLNNLLGLQLSESDVNNIYNIGKSKNPPIILEFVSYLKKASIFPHLKKLKGTKVSITNDLCFEDRQDQKTLIYHQKIARSQGYSTKIKGKTLIIEEEVYTIERLIDLENEEDITDSEQEPLEDKKDDPVEIESESKKPEKSKIQTKEEPETITKKSQKRKRRKIVYSPKQRAETSGGNRLTRSQTKN